MITHNSFKLIIDEKNEEIRKLSNDCGRFMKELEREEKARHRMLEGIFGVPVVYIEILENGKIRAENENGKSLYFEIKLIGDNAENENIKKA
jgi:hypothetical protein